MAIEQSVQLLPGMETAADLSSLQYHVVRINSTGKVVSIAASSNNAIGVLQDKPAASGRGAQVGYSGITKLVAGTSASWTPGGKVGYDTTGRGVPTTASGRKIIGTYIPTGESGIVAGSTLVSVLLLPGALTN